MSQTDLLEPNISGEVGDNPGLSDLPGVAGTLSTVTSKDWSRIQWIVAELKTSEKHVKPWRTEAQTCAAFVSGDQLDEATRQELRGERRPDTSINITQKYLHYVSGLQRRTPQALIFRPTVVDERQQQMVGEYATQCYEWAYRLCNGADSVARAFEDMLTTGLGWTDMYIDRLRDPRGLIHYPRIPWDEMLWQQCSDDNLSTTRWRARESWIEKQEATRRWPDCAGLIASAAGTSNEERQLPDEDLTVFTIPLIKAVPIDKGGTPPEQSHKGRVKVTQFEWYDDQPGYAFRDPISGEEMWLSIRDFHTYEKRLAELMPGMGKIDEDKVHHRVVQVTYLLNRTHELAGPRRLPGDRFTLRALTGHWDHAKRRWYGFVRLLMDPQRSANVFARLAHEIMAVTAKGGAIVQTDAFRDLNQKRQFVKQYAKPGSVVDVAPEALEKGKIKEKSVSEFPAAAMQLLSFAIGPLTDVITGLPGTSLGVDTGGTPGVTMQQGQQVGRTILAKEFDALRLYRHEEGLGFLSFIKLIADGRMVRIGGEATAQVLPLLRKPFVEEYDIYVDETDSDPNMRAMFQRFLLSAMPGLVKSGMFVPEMFDYLPLPVKVRNSLIQSMNAKAKQAQEAAMQGINLGGRGPVRSPREIQARIADVEARAQVHMARAQEIPKKSRREDLQTVIDAMAERNKQEMESKRLNLEHGRTQAQQGMEMQRHSLERSRHTLESDKALAEFAVKLLASVQQGEEPSGAEQ